MLNHEQQTKINLQKFSIFWFNETSFDKFISRYFWWKLIFNTRRDYNIVFINYMIFCNIKFDFIDISILSISLYILTI